MRQRECDPFDPDLPVPPQSPVKPHTTPFGRYRPGRSSAAFPVGVEEESGKRARKRSISALARRRGHGASTGQTSFSEMMSSKIGTAIPRRNRRSRTRTQRHVSTASFGPQLLLRPPRAFSPKTSRLGKRDAIYARFAIACSLRFLSGSSSCASAMARARSKHRRASARLPRIPTTGRGRSRCGR